MSCPHGNGPAPSCSQCLGAPARRIEQSGPDLIVDGHAVRAIEPPLGPGLKQAGRRGGRATGLVTKGRKA